ncbi:MAG: T9SS type A sorting domain-containing protein [Ferruginibacter sp.]
MCDCAHLTASDAQWSLFPNPSTYFTNILFRHQLSNVIISFIDINGKTIYNRSFALVKAGQVINVPLANISKGVYIMKIESENASTSEKLIMQ